MTTSSISFNYKRVDYSFDVQEENEHTTHNLQKLFARKKGELFFVDGGKLQTVSSFEQRIGYFFNKGREQERVKEAINGALGALNDLVRDLKKERVKRAVVRFLFDKQGSGGIGRLERLFDHKLISEENALSEQMLEDNEVRIHMGNHYFTITDKALRGEKPNFPLPIDLADQTENFHKLIHRKKGEIFWVNEEGNLEVVNNCLKYRWSRKENEKKVQDVVSHVMGSLNAYVNRIVNEQKITKAHKVALAHFFSNAYSFSLARMNRKVFDRSDVCEGSNLEAILVEMSKLELLDKRADFRQALINYKNADDKEAAKLELEKSFMEFVFAEFKFAQSLGIDLESVGDGGSGGARYARNRFGHKILVIKPGDEGPHGVNNPQWYAKFKRLFISPRRCLDGNSEPLAEVDSYEMDRRFGFYTVPPTNLRYVTSPQFNGERTKECSVQMYADNCQTLGEYVGISPMMHNLPRSFLRWFSGGDIQEGFFSLLPTRVEKRAELLQKLPQKLIENVALHNFLIEDIDCHFENILVQLDAVEQKTNLEEISDAFIDSFFTIKNNQKFLSALLIPEEVTIDGERKRVALVKHDGGSSNPNRHPTSYLEQRLKHLFEVLPHFEEGFSKEAEDRVFQDEGLGSLEGSRSKQDDIFINEMKDKGRRVIRNIMGNEIFDNFWEQIALGERDAFHDWVLSKQSGEVRRRSELVGVLAGAATDQSDQLMAMHEYCHSHLERTHRNIVTRMDSYEVLRHAILEKWTMRRLLSICSAEDFETTLSEIQADNGFKKTLESSIVTPAKPPASPSKGKQKIRSRGIQGVSKRLDFDVIE